MIGFKQDFFNVMHESLALAATPRKILWYQPVLGVPNNAEPAVVEVTGRIVDYCGNVASFVKYKILIV